MIRYGLLDDDGQVVRWLSWRPAYPHITKRVPKPKPDLTGLDEAPF